MTDEEAIQEAEKRWGKAGKAALLFGRYYVGVVVQEMGYMADGSSWEEAFVKAEKSQYIKAERKKA